MWVGSPKERFGCVQPVCVWNIDVYSSYGSGKDDLEREHSRDEKKEGSLKGHLEEAKRNKRRKPGEMYPEICQSVNRSGNTWTKMCPLDFRQAVIFEKSFKNKVG